VTPSQKGQASAVESVKTIADSKIATCNKEGHRIDISHQSMLKN